MYFVRPIKLTLGQRDEDDLHKALPQHSARGPPGFDTSKDGISWNTLLGIGAISG
jgi:hypothetical protein